MVPRGRQVRPTVERVREAVFNSLHSMGLVADATFVDLFAGSGALGLEALSRGAAHVSFVDDDPRALAAVRSNRDTLGFADRATVVPGDARRVAAGLGPVDVGLCDPPYSFDQWPALLDALRCEVVVLESDRAIEPGPGWAILRVRTYGSSVVTIAHRHPPAIAGDAT